MTESERSFVEAVATLEVLMLRGARWHERLSAERAVIDASQQLDADEAEVFRDLLAVARTLADWRARTTRKSVRR